nr:hypothetical protein [Tanacetum cinerariifolium]
MYTTLGGLHHRTKPFIKPLRVEGGWCDGRPHVKGAHCGCNKTAKDLWYDLARHMLGSEYGEQDRKAAVLYEYETFKAIEEELLLDTYIRYLQVINYLKKCGYSKDNCELNFKFLNNLQPEWKQDVNDVMGLKKKTVVVTYDPLALIAEKTKSANKKQEYVKSDDKKVEKKDDEKKRDMSKVKCYNCKKEEINANMVFMVQIEKVLSDSEASSSSSDEKIAEVSYYISKSESESELIRKFNKKIAKCLKRIEKANQQNKDFKNQNKDLQDKYDVLKNQATTFEMKNNELNEQMKVLIEKNDDLLAQMNVLKDQLQVKHVVIDTHVECQEKYAKLEAERYEYMMLGINKDEYEVWAMKMEYWITNNDMNIWKVIKNGNSLKRTGRDDARDIWNAVKARFGGNAESKKMRKSMLKQEFSEFRISEAEGVYKGYDKMQKILSQLNQLNAKPDTEEINLRFLRALPSSWFQVTLTLKTKGGLEFISFDDLYYKLKTLEMDIKGYSTFSPSQSAGPSHSAFVSATSTTKKMPYGESPNCFSPTTYSVPSNSKIGSYRTGNVIEDVLQSFVADIEPEQQLAYEDLEQIGKLDMEEMDLKWQMAMLSVRVHKLVQKVGRKIDFDKKESARFNKQKEIGRKEEDSKALVSVDTLVDWSNHKNESDEVIAAKEFGMIAGANSEEANTPDDAVEFALIGVTSETKLDNHLVQTEKWRTSSKNLYRLIDSSMSLKTKVGLGFTDCISQKELGWDDFAFSVFTTTSEDVEGRPTFYRFAKTDSMKAVPPPLTRDYTSLSNHTDLDESQMFYRTKSSTSNDSESVTNEFVSCDDSDKSLEDNTSDFASCDSSRKSLEHKPTEIESNVGTPITEPISVKDLPSFTCNSSKKTDHTSKTSCNKRGSFNKKACHFKKHVSSVSKLCFVCGSRAHLIKDCDFYKKQMANSTVGIGVDHAVRPQPVPTGNPMVKPVPTGQFLLLSQRFDQFLLELVRSRLQLSDDEGVTDLPILKIYSGMDALGYVTEGKLTFFKNKFSPQWRFLVHTLLHCLSPKSGSWDQFGSPIAIALICLSDGRRFNWSNYIFRGMVNNTWNAKKFLMYLRFLQTILDIETRVTKQYKTAACSFPSTKDATMGADLHTSPPRSSHTPPADHPSGGVEDPIILTALSSVVSTLVQKVHSLEAALHDHKRLLKDVVGKLVKKVKSLEVKLKTKKRKMVLSDSDEEDDTTPNVDLDALDAPTDVPAATSTTPAGAFSIAPGASSATPGAFSVAPGASGVTPGDSVTLTADSAVYADTLNVPAGPSNKGKSLMVEQDIPVPAKTSRQQEDNRLEAHIKRQQEVLESAKFYNEDDWLNIRAQVEANASLSKTLLGDDVSKDNIPARMAALIKKKRQALAKQLFKERQNRPLTSAQQKAYMRQYVKNQSSAIYNTGSVLKEPPSKNPKSPKAPTPSMSKIPILPAVASPPSSRTRRKSIARKHVQKPKSKIPTLDLDAPAQAFLKVIVDEDSDDADSVDEVWSVVVGWEILSTPLGDINALYRIDGTTKHFTTLCQILHLVDLQDLIRLYGLVVQYYEHHPAVSSGLLFWGDLQVLFDSQEGGKGFLCQEQSKSVGNKKLAVIYYFNFELMKKMLLHKLEIDFDFVGNDLTIAEQLIQFIKNQIVAAQASSV